MSEKKLTNGETASLCMELALLLHSGLNLGDGLHSLAESAPGDDTAAMLSAAADGGKPLSDAMEESGAFSPEIFRLVRVGERAGRTEEALRALAASCEGRERLERRVRSAVLYPAVLLLLMLVVMAVLLTKVLPVFNEVFASLGGQMTGLAGGLVALGTALNGAMPALLILLAAAAAFLAVFAASEAFRTRVLGFYRARRGERGLAGRVAGARFAQAMSMGLRSGLPVEEALELAAAFRSGDAARRCGMAREELERGEMLADTLKKYDVLPPAYCRMLALGVRAGSGDTVMQDIARRMEEDSENAIDRCVGRVEPALVLITSVLVGLILLSVMLPLLNIMAAIG